MCKLNRLSSFVLGMNCFRRFKSTSCILLYSVEDTTLEKSRDLTVFTIYMDYFSHCQFVLRWNHMLSNVLFLLFSPACTKIMLLTFLFLETISVITNDGRNIVVCSWAIIQLTDISSTQFVFMLTILYAGSVERVWPGYEYYPWWISWTCLLNQGLYNNWCS